MPGTWGKKTKTKTDKISFFWAAYIPVDNKHLCSTNYESGFILII